MKYAKQCPKCGSTDLILYHNDGFPDDSKRGIMVGITIFSSVPMERYICCNCGYTEEWVDRSCIEELKRSHKAIQVNR